MPEVVTRSDVFATTYEAAVLPGLSGEGPTPKQFSAPWQSTFAEGTVVEVRPQEAASWIGNFQPEGSRAGVTGVWSTPNPQMLCVVSMGMGYWVDVGRAEAELIKAGVIREVHQVPEHGLQIFVDDTEIAAYGQDGFVWESPRLAGSGLHVSAIREGRIYGSASDDIYVPNRRFELDVRTGKGHTAGTAPE